jgi:hypothetical protein
MNKSVAEFIFKFNLEKIISMDFDNNYVLLFSMLPDNVVRSHVWASKLERRRFRAIESFSSEDYDILGKKL